MSSPHKPRRLPNDDNVVDVETYDAFAGSTYAVSFHNPSLEQTFLVDDDHESMGVVIALFSAAVKILAACCIISVLTRVEPTPAFLFFFAYALMYIWSQTAYFSRIVCRVLFGIILLYFPFAIPSGGTFSFFAMASYFCAQTILGLFVVRRTLVHIAVCSTEILLSGMIFVHQGRQDVLMLVLYMTLTTAFYSSIVFFHDRDSRLRWLGKRTLSDNEKMWDIMMNSCVDPIIVLAGDRTMFTNPAAKAVLGQQEEAEMNFMDAVCPEDKPIVSELLEKVFAGENVPRQELRIKGPNNDYNVFLEISATVTQWRKRHSTVVIARDVTERKKAAKSKSQYIAACSHELRTPLNAIMGTLELLLEQTDASQEETIKCLTFANRSSHLLLNLINDIMDNSKIEEGKLELSNRPFEIRSVLRDALDLVSFQAAQKKNELISSLDANVPSIVVGDANRFRQVLLNLLSNAVKFTHEGRITVSMAVVPSVSPVDKANGKINPRFLLHVAVEDTGCGIQEADLPSLFTMFGKLKDEHAVNPTGSGFGLAICKQLCELMGGDIGVKSIYNQGSTFSFTVRLEEAPIEELTRSPLLKSGPGSGSSTGSNGLSRRNVVGSHRAARILLVDDNDFNLEVAKMMLVQAGHTVDVCSNGKAAVNIFELDWKYDVILMDCEMPIMNGYESTKRIREIELKRGLRRTPIVGLTAYALSGDRETCLKVGMDDHVAKPVSKTVLLETIDRWRQQAQSARRMNHIATQHVLPPVLEVAAVPTPTPTPTAPKIHRSR